MYRRVMVRLIHSDRSTLPDNCRRALPVQGWLVWSLRVRSSHALWTASKSRDNAVIDFRTSATPVLQGQPRLSVPLPRCPSLLTTPITSNRRRRDVSERCYYSVFRYSTRSTFCLSRRPSLNTEL